MAKEFLGYVAVDRGLIAIGDPDYLDRLKREFETWQENARIFPTGQAGTPAGQVYFDQPAESPNLCGVIAETASGDGLYPVYRNTDTEGEQSLIIELGKSLDA